MDIGLISRVLLLSITLILSNEVAAAGMPDFSEEPGLNPTRSLHETDFDAVDPFTGKLQIHQTDISIPGNGGMSLDVTRSYTSGNIWNVGFGYSGWSMDFGFVEENPNYATCPVGVAASNGGNPVLVLPDGSRQVLADVDQNFPSPPYTFPYITNQFWKAECSIAPSGGSDGLIVTSPEGKIYEMKHLAPASVAGMTYWRWYVTKITDKNGNWISITYTNPPANAAVINTVTTSDGRTLTYTYNTIGGSGPEGGLMTLASITDGARTWAYSYIDGFNIGLPLGTFLLNKVTLPDNTTWLYSYNGNLGLNPKATNPDGTPNPAEEMYLPGSYQINSVTTPQGAVVNYQYGYVSFNAGAVDTAVVSRSVVGGATWTYTYTPSSGFGVLDMTSVTMNDPVSGIRTDTYSHFGYNTIATANELWKVGLLSTKTIGTTQTESYTWDHASVTNKQLNLRTFTWTQKYDTGLFYPLLLSKTITRDGATYVTSYTNLDYFANAWGATETGPTGITRTKTFQYSASSYYDPKWILHQKTYEFYNGLNHAQVLDANNNVLIDTRAWVTTTYTYNPDGTVATMTPPGGATYTYDSYGYPTPSSASNGTTYGSYMRGIPQTEDQQDGISLSRIVDSTGNITSETNGNGKTTTYTYDALNRLKSITHPINNAVSIAYTANSKTATRGALVENTLYDGFGRPTSVTLGGIVTTYQYDAEGRMTFKSNPNSATGTSYKYDDIGRVTKVTYADGKFKSTAYGPLTRTVKDENGFDTVYTYYAYGDPDQAYLVNIATPEPAASISIVRDALDNVSSVTQAGITRLYSYGANGYLYQETDPETGVTDYSRDEAGNMTGRYVGDIPSVGTSAWATYKYDYHNRLITMTTNFSSTANTYSNTHKLLTSSFSDGYLFGGSLIPLSSSFRSFSYDDNDNMLTNNVMLEVDGVNLGAVYTYNSNDQIDSITYPISNQTVTFAPDVLGRPTTVSGYASNASYWPSGQVQQITYQNGSVSSYGQNTRLWPSSFNTQSSAGTLIDSSYSYDFVGNLSTITDSTTPAFNRTFGYDKIDRLTTINASSSWGAGTIGYDGAGNITSQTFGTSGVTYTYSPQNQIASVAGSLRNATYTYDTYGNVATDGAGKYFFYDGKPSLVRVGDSNSTAPPTFFTYDGLNKRIKVEKNGIVTYELYDLSGKLLAEYVPSQSNKLTEYLYLGSMRIAQRITTH